VLTAVGMRRPPALEDVSLTVRRGEIVGVTGLLGAGKTELARALVGLDDAEGAIELHGERKRPAGPRAGVRDGILLVPEERKAQAVFPELSAYRNGIVSVLTKGLRALGLSALLPGSAAVRKRFDQSVGAIGVRYASPAQPAGRLSGGNQQKLVIGRALACRPRVLVLDEPTRGVDVGSKRDIYRIVVEQAEAGVGVVLISSDTREVLGLAHRVLVLRDGVVAAEVAPRETTNEQLTILLSPAEAAAAGTQPKG
jgi:ABC-type sugar transport system ATPase subunit